MKFSSPSNRGVPDFILMRGVLGKYYEVRFIEFKSEKGRVSKLQKKIINLIRKLNITVHIVRSIDEGKDIINEAEVISEPGH